MTKVRQGFTLIELSVVVAVISILYAVSLYFLRPETTKARARDVVRVGNMASLQTAVENYISDHGVPPDSNGVLRLSSTSVGPTSSPALADGSGWIGQDLRGYLEKLPVDPINSGSYVYRYKRVGKDYEIDMGLEENTTLMSNTSSDGDGGNSDSRLEKGTDLTILSD